VGPTGVVEADPLSDDTRVVLLGFKAMTMYALLLQRSDHTLYHSVLLRTVRRNELLAKAVAAHDPRVCPRGEDQPVIRPQEERPVDAPEATESCDQRLLERRRCRRRSAASRDLQPSSSRVWWTMTNAKVCQPSRPAQTRHRSVAKRSFGVVATEGSASMRGRCPIALLRTCQPISWKTL
jgi:hypothetical protein